MSFLNPIALALGLLSSIIVVMYLLKLRRKRQEFSSTLLWSKTVEDLTANSPFQKLRQNPLMYLQILLLLLLVAALARPTMWLDHGSGLSRVILIDNTASMNALDGPGGATRLELAIQKARELIRNTTQDDETMLISYGGAVQTLQAFTGESGTLNAALRRLEPTDAPSRLKEAILLARGVLKTRPAALITIISDGGKGYAIDLFNENDPVEYIRVGSSDRNCGIVAFDLRQSFEDETKTQVFSEIENFSSKPANITMRCLLDDKLLQVRQATLAPHDRQGFVFTGLEGAGRRRLKLEIETPGDLLEADNAVHGYIDMDSRVDILLVSNENFFLERVLSLLPGAKVSKIAPKDYQPGLAADLVIFDQFSPPRIGPGRYLFANATPPLEGFNAAEKPVEKQTMLDWNRLHPVTRFLNLNALFFSKVTPMEHPDWAIPLAESAECPLILAGERQSVRLVALPFDFYATDWPMQISFPVFFNNAVDWLAAEAKGSLTGAHRSGQTVALVADREMLVTNPAGESRSLTPDENQLVYYNDAFRIGLYGVGDSNSPGGVGEFAINLLSPEESDIAPKEKIVSGEKLVQAATVVSKANREIWLWFVAAALALLAAEWHFYCRRAWL